MEAVCLIECEAAHIFRDVGLDAVSDMPGMPRAAIRQAIADKMLWMARLKAPDMAVGFALVRHVDGHAHLQELNVLPGYQQRGIGPRLVSAVLGWAHNEGMHRVTLTTFANVAWNAPFYRRLGFETLAETDRGLQLNRIVRHEHMIGLGNIAPRVTMVFRL